MSAIKQIKAVKKKKGKNLLWTLHHWAGLYAGVLIGVICFTGAVAVFIPEINVMILRNKYAVSTDVPEVPAFSKSLEKLKDQYPGMKGLLITLPKTAGQPVVFDFSVKTPGVRKDAKKKVPSTRYTFFVDSSRDIILGSNIQQNSFVNYLRQIHVRLYEGVWGRQLVGLGGVALLVVTVTGLFIYAGFMKKQPYPKIRQGKGWRILMADWHKILGISALTFNFVIAGTGAWLGLQPLLIRWFKIETPNDFEAPILTTPKLDKKTTVSWNEVFKTMNTTFPDLKAEYIRVSDDGSSAITIAGNIKGQVYERSINTLVLSKDDLHPLFKYDIRDQPFSHKFYFVQEALHFGDYGGLGLKVLYTLFGLTSAFLSISGFVVYFYRTEKKSERRMSPLRITFLYGIALILLLGLIAMVSMWIGYGLAAKIAGYLVNGLFFGYLILVIFRSVRRKLKEA